MPVADERAPPDRPVARAPGRGRCQRRRAARRRPGPPPGHGADDPRAALLPSAPRGLRQRRRGVAEPPGRRRGPAERVRVLRRAAHPRRRPRADQRPHPVVAADAADAAPAPRVARREPRSRSRAAQRAQPGQRPAPVGRAHPRVPRVTGGGAPALPPRRDHSARRGHAAAEPESGRPTPRPEPAGHPRPSRPGRVGDARPRLAGRARGAPAGPAPVEGPPPRRRDRPRCARTTARSPTSAPA